MWSWCNDNRNKVCNKCNAFESSPNHPPLPPGLWKNCLPWNWSLVPKRLGTTAIGDWRRATLHTDTPLNMWHLLLPQGLCICSCFCLEYFSLRLSNECLFVIVLIRFIPLVPSISCFEVTLYVCSFISCIDCFLPLDCYLETEPWSVYPLLLYPHTTLSQVLEKKKKIWQEIGMWLIPVNAWIKESINMTLGWLLQLPCFPH